MKGVIAEFVKMLGGGKIVQEKEKSKEEKEKRERWIEEEEGARRKSITTLWGNGAGVK